MRGDEARPMRRSITVTVTAILAGVTTIVSLMIIVGNLVPQASATLGFIPARLSGMLQVASPVPAFLTPLSCTLVHGGFLHLGFNLLMLIWCGKEVERVLGKGGTLGLYMVAAYAAAAAQWIVGPHGFNPMIGASGGISGLVGAYALSFGRPRLLVDSPRLNRWLNIAWLAVAWAALQWAVGFTAQASIATAAHVGGFLAGLALQRPLLLWHYRRA
jgi:membrane associated rhomboid family serine protease